MNIKQLKLPVSAIKFQEAVTHPQEYITEVFSFSFLFSFLSFFLFFFLNSQDNLSSFQKQNYYFRILAKQFKIWRAERIVQLLTTTPFPDTAFWENIVVNISGMRKGKWGGEGKERP